MDTLPTDHTAGLIGLALAYIDAAKAAGPWGVVALYVATAVIAAAVIVALPGLADSVARLRSGISPRERELERKVMALESTVERLRHTLDEWSQILGLFVDDLPDAYDKASLRRMFVPPAVPPPPAAPRAPLSQAAE